MENEKMRVTQIQAYYDTTANEHVLVVLCHDGQVCKSTDGGETWITVKLP